MLLMGLVIVWLGVDGSISVFVVIVLLLILMLCEIVDLLICFVLLIWV